MEQNISETESNWRFRNKFENKQESVSDAFNVWPFSSDFNFATKNG